MMERKVFRPTPSPFAEAEMMERKVFRPTPSPFAEAEMIEGKVFRPTLRLAQPSQAEMSVEEPRE